LNTCTLGITALTLKIVIPFTPLRIARLPAGLDRGAILKKT
jgi:hypothetical protein